MVQIETSHTIFGCNNSENDGCVTVRDRDTMEQERVKIEDLKAYFAAKFEW